MKIKWIAVGVVFSLLLGVFAGCGRQTPSTAEANRLRDGELEMMTFTDSVGREVEVPKEITRISPSGATAQMLLFAIAPDLMVSTASGFGSAAEEYIAEEYRYLPILGQFYGSQDLNYEEIAAVGPQVVIDLGDTKENVIEDMDNISRAIGIPAVHIEATTETTPQAFRTLGKLLNREEAGERLASYCEKVYAETEAIMEQVGGEEANLLYCIGNSGLNVTAEASFQSEVINLVADNAAKVNNPSSRGTGNEVNMEQILAWDPEVIFFSPDSIYEDVANDPTWQRLSAIQKGKYYKVPLGPYNWMGFPPSVNRYLGMMWSTKVLYPEVATFDLYERCKEYYDLFYHCELTQEQFDRLTADSMGPL